VDDEALDMALKLSSREDTSRPGATNMPGTNAIYNINRRMYQASRKYFFLKRK
jgi:hypothetical protein